MTVVIVRRVETVRSETAHPAGTALRVAMAIVRSGPATGTTVRRGRVTAVTPAGRRAVMVRAVPIVRDAMATVLTVVAPTARLVMGIVRSVVGALTVRVVTVTARSRVVQTVRVVMAIVRTAVDRLTARRVTAIVRTVVDRQTARRVMVIVRTVAGPQTGPAVTGTDPSRAVLTVRVAMGTARTAGAPIVPLVTETVRTVVVRPTDRPVVVRPTVRSAGVRRIARLATAAKTVVVSVTAAVTPAPVSVRPRATTGRTATPTAPSRSVRATTTRRSPRRSRRATSTPRPGWS
ncbi:MULTISPECIES: hypothetical protein [unclassified Curtobacterium]|uniref:hypothetical protein n=1 Tax=unclassified Curtobacterium TaxID=257496 RepID=UPI0015E8A9D4|nr:MULTISPECIES: hypothetical protein [unclassified Curtobacterium]